MSRSAAYALELQVAARQARSYGALCARLATLPARAARRRPDAAAVKFLDEMLREVSFDAHYQFVAWAAELDTHRIGYDCDAADGLPHDIVELLTQLINECCVRGRRVPRNMRLVATRRGGYITLKWHRIF